MSRSRGFTLVEMLVAMAVLSLALGWSVWAFREIFPAWQLEASARDLANALRAARARAVLQQTTVSVPFDVARGLYTYSDDVDSGDDLRVAELPQGVVFARPDTGSLITLAPPADPSEEAAVFSSSGLLTSVNLPGAIHLGVPHRDLYLRVEVNLAGIVRVAKWDGGRWR